jgi:hypothetical protein
MQKCISDHTSENLILLQRQFPPKLSRDSMHFPLKSLVSNFAETVVYPKINMEI